MALIVSGCATTKTSTGPTVDYRQYHIWISQTAAIDVEEAYADGQNLYLKYRAFFKENNDSHIFYGQAVWEDGQSKVDLSKNLVVPLNFISQGEWNSRPGNLSSVQRLDHSHWKVFRRRLIERLTPVEEGEGVVLRSDEDELFLYYDSDGQLIVVDLKKKPAGVSVKKVYAPTELADIIVSELSRYLNKEGYNDRRVIMPTFDEDYSKAFMYVDLDRQLAVSLDLAKEEGQRYKENLLKKGIKSADLLIVDSHLLGMLTRPFSSSFRLLVWTKDTAYDVINPQKIRILEKTPPPPITNKEGMDLDQWERKLDGIVRDKPVKGTMDFLVGGDEFFPRLIDTITNAEESIDVRIFIFDNDDYAVEIADLLKRRSKEGIKVRVLLDGMGIVMGEGRAPDNLPPGFIPPDSMMTYLTKESKIEVRVRPNTWFKADHIKTIVIDNKIGYTGGMNIGREYRYDWHDMMIETEGPIIAEIVKEFNLAWEHAGTFGDIGYVRALFTPKPNVDYKGFAIRMLYTRLNDPQIFKAQIAAINNAQKYIYINNAYFSDNAILYALIKARRRGVDVRVILPVNGNHEIMNQSNRVTANIMFKHGIRVFFYPGMSHIKAAIYDGWLCTGTANFDKLSFRDNLELNLATSNADSTGQFLEELFYPDFEKSKEMTEPLTVGLKEYFAEFLAEQL